MGNIFLLVQNQYHSTGVKKSYSCLNFNLSAKKFSGKEKQTEGQPDSKKDRHTNKQTEGLKEEKKEEQKEGQKDRRTDI